MIEQFIYDSESIAKNEGKIETFSLLVGLGIGILTSSGQAFVQYFTNADASVAFLGMGFLNGIIGCSVIFIYWILTRMFHSEVRKKLLVLPERREP